jgi:hypothetical protein
MNWAVQKHSGHPISQFIREGVVVLSYFVHEGVVKWLVRGIVILCKQAAYRHHRVAMGVQIQYASGCRA